MAGAGNEMSFRILNPNHSVIPCQAESSHSRLFPHPTPQPLLKPWQRAEICISADSTENMSHARVPHALGWGSSAALALPPSPIQLKGDVLLTPGARMPRAWDRQLQSLPVPCQDSPSALAPSAPSCWQTTEPAVGHLCRAKPNACFRLTAPLMQHPVKNHNSTKINSAFDFCRGWEHSFSLSLLQDSLGVNT